MFGHRFAIVGKPVTWAHFKHILIRIKFPLISYVPTILLFFYVLSVTILLQLAMEIRFRKLGKFSDLASTIEIISWRSTQWCKHHCWKLSCLATVGRESSIELCWSAGTNPLTEDLNGANKVIGFNSHDGFCSSFPVFIQWIHRLIFPDIVPNWIKTLVVHHQSQTVSVSVQHIGWTEFLIGFKKTRNRFGTPPGNINMLVRWFISICFFSSLEEALGCRTSLLPSL